MKNQAYDKDGTDCRSCTETVTGYPAAGMIEDTVPYHTILYLTVPYVTDGSIPVNQRKGSRYIYPFIPLFYLTSSTRNTTYDTKARPAVRWLTSRPEGRLASVRWLMVVADRNSMACCSPTDCALKHESTRQNKGVS